MAGKPELRTSDPFIVFLMPDDQFGTFSENSEIVSYNIINVLCESQFQSVCVYVCVCVCVHKPGVGSTLGHEKEGVMGACVMGLRRWQVMRNVW